MKKWLGFINVIAMVLFLMVIVSPFSVSAKTWDSNNTNELTEDVVVNEDLYVNGSLKLNGYTLTVHGDYIQNNGDITMGGGKIIVDGNLTNKNGDLSFGDNATLTVGGNFVQCNGDIYASNSTLNISGDFVHNKGIIHCSNAAVIVKGDMIRSDYDDNNNLKKQSSGYVNSNLNTVVSVDGDLIDNSGSKYSVYGTWYVKGDYIDMVGEDWSTSAGLNLRGTGVQKLELTSTSNVKVASTNNQIVLGKYFAGSLLSDLITTSEEENTYVNKNINMNGHKFKVSNNLVVSDASADLITSSGGVLEVGGNVDFKGSGSNYDINCNSGTLIVNGDVNVKKGKFWCSAANVTIGGDLILADYDNQNQKKVADGDLICNSQTVVNVGNVYIHTSGPGYIYGTWNVKGNYTDLTGKTWDNGKLNLCGTNQQCLTLVSNSYVKIKSSKDNVLIDKYFAGELLSDLTVSSNETILVNRNLYLKGKKLTVNADLTVDGPSDVVIGEGGNLTINGDLIYNGQSNVYDLKCNDGELKVSGDYIHKKGRFWIKNATVTVGGTMKFCDYDSEGNELEVSGYIETDKDTIVNAKDVYMNISANTSIYGTWNITGDYVDKKGVSWVESSEKTSVLNLCGTNQQLLDLSKNSYVCIKSQNSDIKLGKYFAGALLSDLTVSSEEEILINKNVSINGKKLLINGDVSVVEASSDIVIGNGGTFEINGDFSYAGCSSAYYVNANSATLKVNGNYEHSKGTLKAEGARVEVEGNLIFKAYDVEGNEKSVDGSIDSNDGSVMIVGGDFYSTMNSNLCGRVYVRGDYTTTQRYKSLNGTLYLIGDVDNYNKQTVTTCEGWINGIELSKCESLYNIDTSYGYISAPVHDYVGTETRYATATRLGEMTYVCSMCEDSYTVDIAKLVVGEHEHTHIHTQVVVIKDSTEEEEGELEFICDTCKDTFSETIQKKPHVHVWDQGVVTKQPTEKSKGVKTYTCTGNNCNETKTESIDKLAHTHKWDAGTITKEPTVNSTGIKKYTCTGCGNSYEEVISKLPAPTERELIEQFVSRMYTKALNRTAEEGGKKYWSDELEKQNTDGANVAYGFIFSDEFKGNNLNDEQFVDVMYATFFDRAADNEGKNYWLGLLNQGSAREIVFAGFVNSKEFEKLCLDAGIEKGLVMDDGKVVNAGIYQFVKRQYTCCLSRDGERAGMDYWATQIATHQISADDVARKFFYSEEFVNKNYSNAEYISVLYTTFMGRNSDQAGLNYWEAQMAAGMTREMVLDSFVASEEFQGILAKYGLK